MSIPQLNTIGHIAEQENVPIHRVRYVLDTRPHIRPSARAGRARLFDREAVTLIRYELRKIDARREVACE